MALVTCAYCGCKTVDKLSQDYVAYKGKNFHKECCEKQKEKDEFYAYVCEVFKLKAPGPRIYSQGNNFVKQHGYTYLGMQQTLYYIYTIKKHTNDRPIDSKSIGLIPYYYDEAQEYFKKIEKKKEIIRKEIMSTVEEVVPVKIAASPKKSKTKQTYSLEEIENIM